MGSLDANLVMIRLLRRAGTLNGQKLSTSYLPVFTQIAEPEALTLSQAKIPEGLEPVGPYMSLEAKFQTRIL